MHDNLLDEREQIRYNDENKKTNKRVEIKDVGKQVFNTVHRCSMCDPCITTTTALRLLEEHFKFSIQEGPIYISDIHWKFGFQKNDIKLNTLENQAGNCNKFSTGKSG